MSSYLERHPARGGLTVDGTCLWWNRRRKEEEEEEKEEEKEEEEERESGKGIGESISDTNYIKHQPGSQQKPNLLAGSGLKINVNVKADLPSLSTYRSGRAKAPSQKIQLQQ